MSLAGKAVRGAALTIGSSLAARVVGIIGTLIITRYLEPEVMGEVASASILVISANVLSNFGLGNYAIAKFKEGPDVTFACTVLFIGFGVVGFGAILAMGDHFSRVFRAPMLVHYLPGLVLASFIRRLGGIPDKVLARQMRFGPIGLSVALGEVTYAASSVFLASQGWGGDAVVWGNVAQSVVMTGIVVSQVSWRDWLAPHKITWARLKDQAAFGVPMGLVASAHYASTAWDNLLYQRFFGSHQMGLYNLGYNLAAVPAVQIGDQVAGVLFPSMSRVDGDAKIRALVRSIGLMGLIIFPLGIGLAAVSESLIGSILPWDWRGVAPIMSALALVTVVRPIAWASGSYLLAQGHTWGLTILEVLKVLSLGIGIIIFSRFGTVWACAGVGVGFTVHAIGNVYLLAKLSVSPISVWNALTRPLWACIPMGAAVLGARYALYNLGVYTPLLSLIVECVVGIVVFIPMSFVFANEISHDFLTLLKKTLKRGG